MKPTRQVCILFLLTMSVLAAMNCSQKAAVTQEAPKAAMAQEVAMRGDPGCHFTGGCPDGPEKCKFCDKNGDCRCSNCCVALSERPADWEAREEMLKKKAEELAKERKVRK